MTRDRLLFVLFFLLNLSYLIAQNVRDIQKDTLESLINRSNDAYEVFNYKDAIKYASELIDKSKQYKAPYYEFLGYDMLGGIYSETDDSIQGRVYSEKALAIARASKVDSLIAWGTLNLGILYSENEKTYEKAIQYFEESIAINKKKNELNQVYLTYISLAWTYLDNGKPDEAFSILNKARSISAKEKIEYPNVLYIELLFARYYQAKKDLSRAANQLEFIAKKADEDSLIDLALETYDNLTVVYNEKEDFKNAFLSLKKFNHYKQKAYTLEKIEETEKARAMFDLKQAEKNLEIALKEKEFADELITKSKSLTSIFIAATGILVLALLGLFLFFKARKEYVDRLKIKNKELILAKEEAEKLSKAKAKFLSTVSHELRTPLYGVIGISTLLKEDQNLKAYEEDLESLKFSADYLLALINDVLLLNKMDAEAITLSQIPYELDNLIHGIVRSFEFSLQERNNNFHLQIDDDIPNALIGDPIIISQLLMNLIGNAVKFNKNGNIWFKLELVEISGEGLYKTNFTIKDDGPGIPLEQQEIIFDEFTQVENQNHSYKGTGLGLTIVKKLLHLHNSKIHLKSQPGEGSEFNFLLDLKKNTDETNVQEYATDGIDEILNNLKLHILIVDDNKINQKITQKILDKYGVDSSLANDGKQAIAMSSSNKYDMVLMDINMPNVNGTEAAIMIRKFDKTIPIIALTAVELDEMRNEIMKSGINDIIHKPYDLTEFLKTILRNLPIKHINSSQSN